MESLLDIQKLTTTETDVNFLKHVYDYMKQTKTRNELQESKSLDFKEIHTKFHNYEQIIKSLRHELNEIKKEKLNLEERNNYSKNKELTDRYISIIREDTNELKQLISIMKGEIYEIRNVVVGENNNSEKQTIIKKEDINKICGQPVTIKGLEHIIHIDKIHSSTLYSPTALNDKRIATCSDDKSICVLSINYEKKTWDLNIKKENAHSDGIKGLCELTNQRLVSCSYDDTIKIWRIGQKDLSLLSTLSNHTADVYKAIPLPYNRFASCSDDKTVRIWSTESPYQPIATLTHSSYVYYLLQLKKKDILVTSCNDNSSLYFWNSSTYEKLNTINNVRTDYCEHMIEVPNGHIAVSSCVSPYPIVIINPTNYSIIKEIKAQEYITCQSALCLFDAYSFIYVKDGKFLQISINNDYDILFKTKSEEQLNGYQGMINIENGKYLIIENKSYGLEIVKPYY